MIIFVTLTIYLVDVCVYFLKVGNTRIIVWPFKNLIDKIIDSQKYFEGDGEIYTSVICSASSE